MVLQIFCVNVKLFTEPKPKDYEFVFFLYGSTALDSQGLPTVHVSRWHYVRHTTLGRNHLQEISARRRVLYQTTHNTHNRQTDIHAPCRIWTAIAPSERPQTHALDRAATGNGTVWIGPRYGSRKKFDDCGSENEIFDNILDRARWHIENVLEGWYSKDNKFFLSFFLSFFLYFFLPFFLAFYHNLTYCTYSLQV
jgi:hypothetical protein